MPHNLYLHSALVKSREIDRYQYQLWSTHGHLHWWPWNRGEHFTSTLFNVWLAVELSILGWNHIKNEYSRILTLITCNRYRYRSWNRLNQNSKKLDSEEKQDLKRLGLVTGLRICSFYGRVRILKIITLKTGSESGLHSSRINSSM